MQRANNGKMHGRSVRRAASAWKQKAQKKRPHTARSSSKKNLIQNISPVRHRPSFTDILDWERRRTSTPHTPRLDEVNKDFSSKLRLAFHETSPSAAKNPKLLSGDFDINITGNSEQRRKEFASEVEVVEALLSSMKHDKPVTATTSTETLSPPRRALSENQKKAKAETQRKDDRDDLGDRVEISRVSPRKKQWKLLTKKAVTSEMTDLKETERKAHSQRMKVYALQDKELQQSRLDFPSRTDRSYIHQNVELVSVNIPLLKVAHLRQRSVEAAHHTERINTAKKALETAQTARAVYLSTFREQAKKEKERALCYRRSDAFLRDRWALLAWWRLSANASRMLPWARAFLLKRKEKQEMKEMTMAIMVVQRYYRRFCVRKENVRRDLAARQIQSVFRARRLLIYIRHCRYMATILIRVLRGAKMRKVLKIACVQYYRRCQALQRICQGYFACTGARMSLLLMQWNKRERDHIMALKLAKEKKIAQAKVRERRAQARLELAAQSSSGAAGVVDPVGVTVGSAGKAASSTASPKKTGGKKGQKEKKMSAAEMEAIRRREEAEEEAEAMQLIDLQQLRREARADVSFVPLRMKLPLIRNKLRDRRRTHGGKVQEWLRLYCGGKGTFITQAGMEALDEEDEEDEEPPLRKGERPLPPVMRSLFTEEELDALISKFAWRYRRV
jgi:hypothetical protein